MQLSSPGQKFIILVGADHVLSNLGFLIKRYPLKSDVKTVKPLKTIIKIKISNLYFYSYNAGLTVLLCLISLLLNLKDSVLGEAYEGTC